MSKVLKKFTVVGVKSDYNVSPFSEIERKKERELDNFTLKVNQTPKVDYRI